MFNRFLRRGVTAGGGLLAGSAAAYISAPVAAAPAAGPFDSVAAGRTAKVENRVLGGRHKVILGWWPVLGARQQNDPRASSLRAIVAHAKASGYEGIEFSVEDMKSTFYSQSTPDSVVMNDALACAPSGFFTGGTYHILNGNDSPYASEGDFIADRPTHDWSSPNFTANLQRALMNDKAIGAGYATFQVFLPPRYTATAGEYRNDDAYLSECARHVEILQGLCAQAGLNCYIETHIGMFSEDLEAFVKVMDRAPYFEVNADLSHYLYRNIKNGPSLPRVLARVGHMHARMVRIYGDLSADVEDPAQDWNDKGVTWQAFEYYKPALEGGLSSRCIMGETGPMHLVKDALSLDAKLVPLWRAMADFADNHSGQHSPSASSSQPMQPMDEEQANRLLQRHFDSK